GAACSEYGRDCQCQTGLHRRFHSTPFGNFEPAPLAPFAKHHLARGGAKSRSRTRGSSLRRPDHFRGDAHTRNRGPTRFYFFTYLRKFCVLVSAPNTLPCASAATPSVALVLSPDAIAGMNIVTFSSFRPPM